MKNNKKIEELELNYEFEERAAIYEFEANMTKEQAEILAKNDLLNKENYQNENKN